MDLVSTKRTASCPSSVFIFTQKYMFLLNENTYFGFSTGRLLSDIIKIQFKLKRGYGSGVFMRFFYMFNYILAAGEECRFMFEC